MLRNQVKRFFEPEILQTLFNNSAISTGETRYWFKICMDLFCGREDWILCNMTVSFLLRICWKFFACVAGFDTRSGRVHLFLTFCSAVFSLPERAMALPFRRPTGRNDSSERHSSRRPRVTSSLMIDSGIRKVDLSQRNVGSNTC
jgi:hypothetical protein